MLIRDLVNAMQAIAPIELAESWDNVGLIVGSREAPLGTDGHAPVMLTIDLTADVLAEAIQARAGAIIAYHPPIFEPLKRLTADTPKQRLILDAIRAGLAIYSPHTALDAAPAGMTEWLCEGITGAHPSAQAGAAPLEPRIKGDVRAIRPHAQFDPRQQLKVVTFVPELRLDDLRAALATAGAGIIGHYLLCSFATPGLGTFLGSEQSNPTVGKPGRLERVTEYRLEMVCARASLPIVMETLKQFHPYETPAVDVYELEPKPLRSIGLGRRVVLDGPITPQALAERVQTFLGIPVVRLACAPGMEHKAISKVGVCPGSGAELASLARADGCEVYVTGEMGHHRVMAELDAGMSVILAGHTNTERGYLPRLARRLAQALPGLKALVSQRDKSPFSPA
jgi:dinuclear metal center YbgI/SA1388 family protein